MNCISACGRSPWRRRLQRTDRFEGTGVGDAAVFKRPESVLVVVYDGAGNVLLLRRRQPNWFWQSVTGSLRWQETPRRAAARELFEETGLRAGAGLTDWGHSVTFPIVPPWKARYAPGVHTNREHWFGLRLPTSRMVRIDPREHREYRWLPLPAAWQRASSWTNRQALERLHRLGAS